MNMNAQKLRELGWKHSFQHQLSIDDAQELVVARVGADFGSQILFLTGSADILVPASLTKSCGPLAVGDWLLLEPGSHRAIRRLERESLLTRKAAGEKVEAQLIAANLDTLFIVSSCNHDFNLSRLERYLALAAEAQVNPVVVLTKSDLCEDPIHLRQQASGLKSGLCVEAVDARDSLQMAVFSDWCQVGQTVALVGSSGVGKSTLAISMGVPGLTTQSIREDDSKGRHTTTARCIHRLDAGGLLIDTPGMRELQLADCESGVAEVFDDVVTLAASCRFSDCRHQSEPGCAVQAAIESGSLDSRRLNNYFKLQSEQARNSKSLRQQRDESRKQGKFFKSVISAKQRRRNLGD